MRVRSAVPTGDARPGNHMPQEGDRQQEGVLLVKAPDAAPGGVLREEDDQHVDRHDREDGEPPGPAEDPVPGALPRASDRAYAHPVRSRAGTMNARKTRPGSQAVSRGIISIFSR